MTERSMFVVTIIIALFCIFDWVFGKKNYNWKDHRKIKYLKSLLKNPNTDISMRIEAQNQLKKLGVKAFEGGDR